MSEVENHDDQKTSLHLGESSYGERANFAELVLGCIEAKIPKQLLIGMTNLHWKKYWNALDIYRTHCLSTQGFKVFTQALCMKALQASLYTRFVSMKLVALYRHFANLNFDEFC